MSAKDPLFTTIEVRLIEGDRGGELCYSEDNPDLETYDIVDLRLRLSKNRMSMASELDDEGVGGGSRNADAQSAPLISPMRTRYRSPPPSLLRFQ
ncbi:hypothetical protein FQN55_007463 [Onygenales sp. PD_40]|nr:hypothetical protein FQN55_007463 [Onygenales sp. PD_40]